jgi:hypothetical protein
LLRFLGELSANRKLFGIDGGISPEM